MSEVAIRVENLGKKYVLRHQEPGRRYKALRDVLTDKARALFRSKDAATAANTREDFWALHDVSFEIREGESVGIIGRNGAGKSTLLKILSRITEPTKGRIEIAGRVASLLEVGTGFHPELTGRENIFLNGAILGMSRADIRRRFDEIVAFAEVERFLDTPVKRYSSGMYMRLAFAVAAHLEPEILIVDEVLAVGDMEFQKKCLGRMNEVSTQGRTVLFVSHNMDAVMRLCTRAIHLAKGGVVNVGPAHAVVADYVKSQVEQPARVIFPQHAPREDTRRNLVMISADWPTTSPHPPWHLPFGEEITFAITFECHNAVQSAEIGIGIFAPTGTEFASSSSITTLPNVVLKPGLHRFEITYRSMHLVPNSYTFGIGMQSNFGFEDYHPKAFSLDVVESEASSKARTDTFQGYVVPDVNYVIG